MRAVLGYVDTGLLCMLTLVITVCVTGKLNRAVHGSNCNFGLRKLSTSDTGCKGDPYGDRLKDLCATQELVTCCLYKDVGLTPGLCLDIEGGDHKFLRTLLPQLPVDNITSLSLSNTNINEQWDSLCILSNLQLIYVSNTGMDVFACLTQLRAMSIVSDRQGFSMTNTTFRGLNYLKYLYIEADGIEPPPDILAQFQATKKLISLRIVDPYDKELDIWPLCVGQTHPEICISFRRSAIMYFTNNLSSPQCNIHDKTHLLEDALIDLSFNAITYVSDIATGWGFSSLHHFITSLMSDKYTDFPINLEGNPFRCDCRDLDLYRLLRDPQYGMHLTNLATLVCDHPLNLKGRLFKTLLDSELGCDSAPALPLILGVSVGGTVLLAMSLFGFLFCNRVRLYRWSGYTLHPWGLDECIGENKEFDVFVAHASEDEPWTLELIEELEIRGFKVLFHKRDFEVGVTKIENIMMAVDKSKRTICVLSPSFVASRWCSWEFITVFNDDIEEHKRRLLLIVKERVAWESLSLAMQRYMRDFTYIDAESKYFLDNLLYSLPVKRLGETRGAGKSGVGRDCHADTSDSTSETGLNAAGEQTPLLPAV